MEGVIKYTSFKSIAEIRNHIPEVIYQKSEIIYQKSDYRNHILVVRNNFFWQGASTKAPCDVVLKFVWAVVQTADHSSIKTFSDTNCRQQTTNNRQQTTNYRQQTTNNRQQTLAKQQRFANR